MSKIIKLSYKERSELEQLRTLHIGSWQYQRAMALLLLDQGESVEEVAETLLVSRQVIYKWVNWFKQRSTLSPADRLLDSPRSGRPATAKGVIDPLIDKIIDADPRNYGYNSTVWTAELLRRYLSKYHHCDVSVRSIGYAIARLQIRWKLPRYVLSRQQPNWRQAKGGLKRGSGHIRAR
jgi:transposase